MDTASRTKVTVFAETVRVGDVYDSVWTVIDVARSHFFPKIYWVLMKKRPRSTITKTVDFHPFDFVTISRIYSTKEVRNGLASDR